MRIFINLSLFAFIWLSLVSGSAQLNMDVKIICDGRLIQCECNHGAEPCNSLFYNIGLHLSHAEYGDKSLKSIMEMFINSVIQKFQRAGILNFRSEFVCSSMRLIRKNLLRDENGECSTLWQASLTDVLNRLDVIENLALEINLVQAARSNEYSCDADSFLCR